MTERAGLGNEDIRRDERDGIITLTFTRDRKLNAVTEGMLDTLRAAVADLRDRGDLRVLVITAEGRYFTAGADLTALPVGETGPGTPGPVFRGAYRRLHELFDEIEAIEKPVILAAQGPCLGIGVELGASCDFRFASGAALFGLPEVRNLAALPGSGGISRLTRLVGPHWTKWLAMAGQQVSAAEALSIGLVHAVYPVDGFAARVSCSPATSSASPRRRSAWRNWSSTPLPTPTGPPPGTSTGSPTPSWSTAPSTAPSWTRSPSANGSPAQTAARRHLGTGISAQISGAGH